MSFEKVARQKAKLRLALTGVSGSGKTLGALYIAYGLIGDWSKIALIDTEHERARFYASRTDLGTGEFLYANFPPPHSPERYIDLVRQGAEAVGPDGVVIVDSFSHAWNSEGGVLDIKEKIAQQSGKNSYTAWHEAGQVQGSLVNSILAVDCHTIVTMRSKMDYVMQENDKGKQVPIKVGLAPVQRDDTEYEFDIVLDIARNHIATASKDTTFLDKFGDIITPDLGTRLADWLNNGKEPEKCSVCNGAIQPTKGRSVSQMIEGTVKLTGKAMCGACFKAWQKLDKERLEIVKQVFDQTDIPMTDFEQFMKNWVAEGQLSDTRLPNLTPEEFGKLQALIEPIKALKTTAG